MKSRVKRQATIELHLLSWDVYLTWMKMLSLHLANNKMRLALISPLMSNLVKP